MTNLKAHAPQVRVRDRRLEKAIGEGLGSTETSTAIFKCESSGQFSRMPRNTGTGCRTPPANSSLRRDFEATMKLGAISQIVSSRNRGAHRRTAWRLSDESGAAKHWSNGRNVSSGIRVRNPSSGMITSKRWTLGMISAIWADAPLCNYWNIRLLSEQS